LADRIIALFLLAFSIFYLIETVRLPQTVTAIIGPRSFPILIGLLLLSLSGVLLWRSYRDIHSARIGKRPPPRVRRENIIFVTLGLFVYIFVLKFTGYVISTFLFLIAVMSFWNRGKLFLSGILALGFSVGTYLLIRILGISLPKGLFGLP